ncbi:MAG TPA: RimK family alpha-L-glutamate ligase [Candidatus Nanoarchaeia archaeon]|nr:RimK family alpha-L-glutamate ligase [Candidatus Nanoarchaeia archaeon]
MKLKAALISMNSVSSQWTAASLKKYFDQVDTYDIRKIEVNMGDKEEVLHDGSLIERYDCIYAKGSFHYNALLRAITTVLHKQSYMPIVPTAFTLGHDKLLTQLKLEQSGIPMPRTYLAATPAAAHRILERITYPAVMKFPEGTQGKGVMFADSYASASSILDALDALKQPFIIQEYIESGGMDTRVIVVGDKVAACMRRKAKSGEMRANVHAGGKGKKCAIDYETGRIAVNAAKAIGADICAVDILDSAKGPLVIEVNLSPGLQGITEATGIDVADQIARYLFERTSSLKGSSQQKTAQEIMESIKPDQKEAAIITHLTFRGEKIVLPSVVTKLAKLTEHDEVVLKVEKGKITIGKS